MTREEYNQLFHKENLNLVAFKIVNDCDEEILRLANAAIAEEREACAKVADGWPDYDVQGLADAIRARGQA